MFFAEFFFSCYNVVVGGKRTGNKDKAGGFIRRIVLAVFDVGYQDRDDIENVKICQLTNILDLIITVYMFGLGTAVLLAGESLLYVFYPGMGLVGLLNYLLLRRYKKSRTAVNVVVTMMSAIVLFMVASGGSAGAGLIWIVLHPLLVLPLKGPLQGSLHTFFFLVIAVVMYRFGYQIGLYNYAEKADMIQTIFQQMFFIYIAVYLITYTFIQNKHGLYQELKRLSFTDALTLLPNRRSINVMVNHYVSLFKRQLYKESQKTVFKVPFSCIFCDIDDFKNVNDTYGHDSGDLVLQRFAVKLKHSLRGADFIGRWGGEEFLIILGGTDLEQAKIVARKLIAAVETQLFRIHDDLRIHITMSCAVATFTAKKSDLTFFRELDENLNFAKQHGKNCGAAEGKII